MQDVIYANLYPGDTCLTNGPIFNDFTSSANRVAAPVAVIQPAEESEEHGEREMRLWTTLDEERIEAKLNVVVGQQVILDNAKGKQVKLSLDHLSAVDREYIVFATPPRFNINFFKRSAQIPNPPLSPWVSQNQRPLQMYNYTFGTRVKQESTGEYNHPLTIEYFAVGEEIDGNNFVLLHRMTSSFIPTAENQGAHEFFGEQVKLMRIAYRSSAPLRGIKYGGYLVTITDERGNLIQHETSNKFLYAGLNNLKQLKQNNHFNKECHRVIPARPNEDSRGPGAIRGN
jgi:hypothetical protein